MGEVFKAVKIEESVYWVGAIDWALSDFHGYRTDRGTTYNAYLVLGDKPVLIDTVKARFKDEMLSRIASVVEPREIAYVISNHSEMDHTGALPWVIQHLEPEKVFASGMGVKALKAHFGIDAVPVANGEKMNIGGVEFLFAETRMLHWPDSMFTYMPKKGILFSQDAFGMHLASTERFADEIQEKVLFEEGAKYFANILLPYAPLVLKLLSRVGEMGITPKIIAPDHGPVWRKDLDRILGWYSQWADQKPTMRAVVVYDTMWQSTALMARAIGEGLQEGGAKPVLMPLSKSHRSNVITEVLFAGALIVGSPTINNGIFPRVADVLMYLKGLKPKNLVGAVFGSYGWSGEAVGYIESILEEMNVDIVGSVKAMYVPSPDKLQECYTLGMEVAKKLKEVCYGDR